MGMYDWVTHPPEPCWKCGEPVEGWQSKDGPRQLEYVRTDEVGNFYADCRACGAWNEYRVYGLGVMLRPDHGKEWAAYEDRDDA